MSYSSNNVLHINHRVHRGRGCCTSSCHFFDMVVVGIGFLDILELSFSGLKRIFYYHHRCVLSFQFIKRPIGFPLELRPELSHIPLLGSLKNLCSISNLKSSIRECLGIRFQPQPYRRSDNWTYNNPYHDGPYD
jgi:hypothetical protein